MAQCCYLVVLLTLSLTSALLYQVSAFTDPSDVTVLKDLYRELNYPQQLVGWNSSRGDPCEELWKGISCNGSSVIFIQLNGLELSGRLGDQLFNLVHLKQLNISSNHIYGEIPASLPTNATYIDLSFNNFSGNIPYSLTSMKYLRHLNLSHNSLSGPVGNVFTSLQNLKRMDLSNNNFTEDLPTSFQDLKNLTALFLQNNQFTGSVIFLANLPLTDLDIQNNHFSGVVPQQFQYIRNLWFGENKFQIGANYPPWNFPSDQNLSSQPKAQSNAIESYPTLRVEEKKQKRFSPGALACMVAGVALVATCAAAIIAIKISQSRVSTIGNMESNNSSFHTLPISTTIDWTWTLAELEENTPSSLVGSPPILCPRRIPSVRHSRNETLDGTLSFTSRNPPIAKMYTMSELKSATNNFSEDNLLGEGSLGSVYKAEFPEGQIFAVKNINTVALSLHEEEQFLDVIRSVAHLRHPNIITLIGYSMENGHHLLVYEYVRNWTLEKALHNNDKAHLLPWSAQITISLGIARALDYLHSTCSPPVAHINLKAANILLDDEFMPHLCDCGLAVLRPLTSNSIKLKASELAISYTGYTAPENGQPKKDHMKSDVFAFGVLLLELVTGRKPFDSSRPRQEQSLVKWASSRLYDYDSLKDMVDPRIKNSFSSRSLSQFADIVSLCIQSEPEFRPTMSEVAESLVDMMERSSASGKYLGDGSEADPVEMSFQTTYTTGFIGSPVTSYASF